jgi:hypothetical protein
MDTFPITIQENNNLTRTNRPVRLGIPFPRGKLKNLQQLELINETGEQLPFQSKITAHWDDQSFRWILIDFLTSIKPNQTIQYQLNITSNSRKSNTNKALGYSENEQEIIVATGVASFHIDKHNFAPFKKIITPLSDRVIDGSKTSLVDDSGELLLATIKKIEYPQQDQDQRLTFKFEGVFKKSKTPFLRFKSSLTFFVGSALCELDFTLHNPDRAIHPGGFWDMGDPGSKYFKSLAISLGLSGNTKTFWKNLEETAFNKLEGEKIRLYQDSSGGENWKHHIHINKEGDSTVKFKGYQLTSDNKTIKEGLRATPIFQMKNEHGNIEATIKQFWENFPKSLSYDKNNLNIELFPITEVEGFHELQGGEQKTHTVLLNCSDQPEAVAEYLTPLIVTLPLKYYYHSNAMPLLPEIHQPGPLDTIIQEGLTGESSFFRKRENADEYGWRNFGELWADHETLEHGNDDSLISHYNNQYDPIYGFARQYLLTGDRRWYTLMDDLAKHVIDIDIYRTDEDRPEYNNGLFWHTDHYLDGRHCTHRTFSKTHLEIDHVEQSGGGPSSEHCYTTGLMYHYLLTGNQNCKSSVLQLAQWSIKKNEGTNTLLERIFNILKKDISKLKRLLKNEYVFKYSFPLSRGTGNYINTLLDAYLITQDNCYLDTISKIIQNTIGSNDDIQQRNLMTNIELNWHYTVFLQSISRFLFIKESINQNDYSYQYALQSFIHYADWVFKNEKPYLDNANILVYPNDTWVGQDSRKAAILNTYTRYCTQEIRKDVFEKIAYYLNYIESHFIKTKNHSTRIQALLMQNYTPRNFQKLHGYCNNVSSIENISEPKLSISLLLHGIVKDLGSRLLKVNIRNEIQWVINRLP